jgi:hypothetical protein
MPVTLPNSDPFDFKCDLIAILLEPEATNRRNAIDVSLYLDPH